MERKAGTSGLLWANEKLDALVIDAILTVVVALLAIMLAVVLIAFVLPLANPEVAPGTEADVGASSASWYALGQSYTLENEGGIGGGVAQALDRDEAYAYAVSFAHTGELWLPTPAGQ